VHKKLVALAMFVAANLAFAGNNTVMFLSISNFTNNPGTIFLGTSAPGVNGPPIGINGDTVQWSPSMKGSQGIGLVVGTVNIQLCFVNGGLLILNPAIYKGDAITIIMGQQQFPAGIACGCFGSACAVG